MKAHYKDIVKANEAAIRWTLKYYDPSIKALGGPYGYASYGMNSGSLETLVSGYYCEDSRYYKDDDIFEKMNDILAYCDHAHRPNYTIDMMESNFYTGPLFECINLSRAYKIMAGYAQTDREKDLLIRYHKYLYKAGMSLVNGGIHTPNHRWIGSAAMMMLYNILGMPELKAMADGFLNEGVDMDENGEWTERSAMYNEVCDTSFINLYEETKDIKYLDPVKRNLDLMFTYIEPNFTVFTQNSNRKDKMEGDVANVVYPGFFYFDYAYMAYLTGDPYYASFADDLVKNIKERGGTGPSVLWMYLIHPQMKDFDPVRKPYPKSYNVFHTDIVRRKADDLSITLMTRSPNFLFIQKGELRCFVRICASFFAVAQFVPEKITRMGDDTYYVSMKAHGEYYGPMTVKPATPVWKDMDKSLRPVVNPVDLEYCITVTMEDRKVSLDIKTNGCDRVPYKVEFCFTAPCTVINNKKTYEGEAGRFLTFCGNDVEIARNEDKLIINDAFSNHTFHYCMRGSVPQCMDAFTVYYTDFTNVDKKIEIMVP
ncbi:MAG: hypothetical protein WCY62_04995 [Clostridia bacterium]|jgi:hypothetical protein